MTCASIFHAGAQTTKSSAGALSRRQALVQLPGSALLASLATLLAAEQLGTAVPPAVAAPGPRQLDAAAKAAVAAALNKIVTKTKVCDCVQADACTACMLTHVLGWPTSSRMHSHLSLSVSSTLVCKTTHQMPCLAT
jgi:hypothetical protein